MLTWYRRCQPLRSFDILLYSNSILFGTDADAVEDVDDDDEEDSNGVVSLLDSLPPPDDVVEFVVDVIATNMTRLLFFVDI